MPWQQGHHVPVSSSSPQPTQSFTPYSVTIGGVVRELHRGLILALTAEANSTTLTQLIKCLGLLVANSSYHQLSAGYIARVTATLGRLSSHKGEGRRGGRKGGGGGEEDCTANKKLLHVYTV